MKNCNTILTEKSKNTSNIIWKNWLGKKQNILVFRNMGDKKNLHPGDPKIIFLNNLIDFFK